MTFQANLELPSPLPSLREVAAPLVPHPAPLVVSPAPLVARPAPLIARPAQPCEEQPPELPQLVLHGQGSHLIDVTDVTKSKELSPSDPYKGLIPRS